MDKAGIRIITYIDSDVERISTVIEREFRIDSENSVDKTKLLDVNQVGYRSVHYIARLSKKRTKLQNMLNLKI